MKSRHSPHAICCVMMGLMALRRSVILCTLIALAAACTSSGHSSQAPLPGSSTSQVPSDATDRSASPTSSDGSALPGEPVVLHTHCGVKALTVAGVLWIADPARGGDNPPAGWDENDQSGFFARTTSGHGVFDDGRGHRAEFRLASPQEHDPLLGCV